MKNYRNWEQKLSEWIKWDSKLVKIGCMWNRKKTLEILNTRCCVARGGAVQCPQLRSPRCCVVLCRLMTPAAAVSLQTLNLPQCDSSVRGHELFITGNISATPPTMQHSEGAVITWPSYVLANLWFVLLNITFSCYSLQLNKRWMLNVSHFTNASFECWMLITGILYRLYTIMYRFDMSCQMTLFCYLVVTLITRILHTFMYRLNMFCKITL